MSSDSSISNWSKLAVDDDPEGIGVVARVEMCVEFESDEKEGARLEDGDVVEVDETNATRRKPQICEAIRLVTHIVRGPFLGPSLSPLHLPDRLRLRCQTQ